MNKPQIVHPELELVKNKAAKTKNNLEPIYSTTEKLKARGLGGRQLAKLTEALFTSLTPSETS